MRNVSLVLVAVVLAGGCGSTVAPQAGSNVWSAGPQLASDGLSAPAARQLDARDSATQGVAGDSDATPEIASGETGTTSRPPGEPASTGAVAQPEPVVGAPARAAPGVTATTIKLGIIHNTNVDSADNAVGGGSQESGSEKDVYETLIAAVNEAGGIAGRRVVPVFSADDASSAETREQKEQAACARFTQDDRVFAVLGSLVLDTLRACLQRKGVALIAEFYTYAQRSTFAEFPDYYEPGSIPVDRLAAALGDVLPASGYLTSWDTTSGSPGQAKAKVGVLTLDTPAFTRAVDRELVPRLTRAGVPSQVVRVPPASRTSDAGATTAAVSSAVLRFRNDGVTHVVFMTAAALVPLSFLTTAESQGYRPRYAYTSQELLPIALETGAISDPDRQLAGSVGLGYWPVFDVPHSGNPYRKSNPVWAGCLRMMNEAGKAVSGQAEPFLVMACDRLEFLKQAAMRAPVLTVPALRGAVTALGTSYRSAFTLRTDFRDGRRSGPAAARLLTYGADCDCLSYSGSDLPLPR